MKNILKITNNLLEHVPNRGEGIKRHFRTLISVKKFLSRLLNGLINASKLPDADTIYWIAPKLIVFHTDLKDINSIHVEDRVFDAAKFKGAVLDGDWDLSTLRFTDLDIYKAFDAVINHNARWQDTEFYSNKLKMIEDGRFLWGCRSKSDFDLRCNFLNALIESIRQHGYRLNYDCYLEGEIKGVRGYFEEVAVNIGRNGQYLFQDGRHRLSIALLLGIERIPVKILVRHAQCNTAQR